MALGSLGCELEVPPANVVEDPRVTLPPIHRESIAREACSLEKLDAVRCAVPGELSCMPLPLYGAWTDLRERSMLASSGGECVDYRCSFALTEVRSDGALGRPEILSHAVEGYSGWIGGVRRALGWSAPERSPAVEHCFELPPYDQIPIEGAAPWTTSLLTEVDDVFFPDECGDLHFLVAVNQQLVDLGVVAGAWQAEILGPSGLLGHMSLATRFTHPIAVPEPNPQQRAVVSWPAPDWSIWIATYSTASGWTSPVRVADFGAGSDFSVYAQGRPVNSYSRTVSGITLDDQAYSLWVSDDADYGFRLWLVLIDSRGVPGDPILVAPLDGATIARRSSGPDEIHYWVLTDDNRYEDWFVSVGQGTISEPSRSELEPWADWSLTGPAGAAPGRPGVAATESSVSGQGPYSSAYSFEYDSEGRQTQLSTISGTEGDAVLDFASALASTDVVATWTQWRGYQWGKGKRCRTSFIHDERSNIPQPVEVCDAPEPWSERHAAVVDARRNAHLLPTCP